MSNLDENKMMLSIELFVDENGFFGRECPQEDCKKYFKVLPGTGIRGNSFCICPYCGYSGSHQEFFTNDQVKRLETAAMNVAYDQTRRMLNEWGNGIKSSMRLGLDPPMRMKNGAPYQLHIYSEKDLETHIECNNCTLKYAVYGVFAFCPDCGQHNSRQIFANDLELIDKSLAVAESADDEEFKQLLIEAALDRAVSNFDGFGRELWKIFAIKAGQDPNKSSISFQNLKGANTNFQKQFGFELKSGIQDDEWHLLILNFQKRHLISHRKGVIDQEYIEKTGDPDAIIGRKIKVHAEDISGIIPILLKLTDYLHQKVDSFS